MLATIHDKNNIEALELNHISDAGNEWKDNDAGYIKVVWERWKL
jgi:hypothetical protein